MCGAEPSWVSSLELLLLCRKAQRAEALGVVLTAPGEVSEGFCGDVYRRGRGKTKIQRGGRK